jgi:general secretion pathway protein B
MSYILDALRKSEQERQRGKVPDLNSYKDDNVAEPSRRNIWPWVTAAVVVINLTIVAIIWAPARGPQSTPVAQTSPVPVTPVPVPVAAAPTPAPVPAPTVQAPAQQVTPTSSVAAPVHAPAPDAQAAPSVPAPQLTQVPAPVPQTVMVDTRPPVQATPTVVSPQTPEAYAEPEEPLYPAHSPNIAYMPQLEELPADERAGIPDMTFSSHMYSSMPRFRSIIINGKRLKEGEYFTEDLQVREITDKGVIMSKGSVLFAVDVLGRWAQ